MNKLAIGIASLAMLAAPLAASAQSYHGRDGGGWNHSDYGRGYDRDGGGAALAAGVAGLAIGAALADRGDYGYAPAPAYGYGYGYAPDYGYAYGPRCFWRTQPYRTYYGGVAYRQVQVCR